MAKARCIGFVYRSEDLSSGFAAAGQYLKILNLIFFLTEAIPHEKAAL